MIVLQMTLVPDLAPAERQRVTELLGGEELPPAHYAGLSDEVAIEVMTLIERITPDEARERLATFRLRDQLPELRDYL